MKLSHLATAMAAACIAAYPAIVLAADSTLVLVIGGEAYDGPPKFAVTFDGIPLGEGAVAAAIDTASVGRFADATDKTPYVQSFTFMIPQDLFRPEGSVGVRFINEAYGGDGSNRDRNLYLASVTVNGRAVTASGLNTRTRGSLAPNAMLGEFLVLVDGNSEAVSNPPPGGWPGPSAIAALVAPPAIDDVRTGAIAQAAPSSSVEPEPEAAIEVASLDQNPEGAGPVCDLDEIYNVIGFNENSNELTPKLIERLDQVAADIGTRQCNVQITGYSSKQGSYAMNALFAVERAQNALHYLLQQGVKFTRASAAGVGATDQFGPDFSSNRRVVISVSP